MNHATPGVTIQPLTCRLPDLRITLDAPHRRLDPAARARVDQHWLHATARNPRLFDGPILDCIDTDPDAATLRCRRSTFRHLLCQPHIDTGTHQTSVTGVLLARDHAGLDHLLLAQRGPQTRVYPNLWELAPSGGIDPPAHTDSATPPPLLTGLDALRQLLLEIEEELDLHLTSPTPSDPPCLCIDHGARSVDVVLPLRLSPADSAAALAAPRPANWEYTDARWIPLPDLPAFDTQHADRIIPPTRALFRFFNWA